MITLTMLLQSKQNSGGESLAVWLRATWPSWNPETGVLTPGHASLLVPSRDLHYEEASATASVALATFLASSSQTQRSQQLVVRTFNNTNQEHISNSSYDDINSSKNLLSFCFNISLEVNIWLIVQNQSRDLLQNQINQSISKLLSSEI